MINKKKLDKMLTLDKLDKMLREKESFCETMLESPITTHRELWVKKAESIRKLRVGFLETISKLAKELANE